MSKKNSSRKAENLESNVEKNNIRRGIRYKGACSRCGGHKWVSEKVYKQLKDKGRD